MSKGDYYKAKTKRWFEKQGYWCEYLERVRRVWNEKKKEPIYIKQDIAGADGLAMNGKEIIFWNSKSGRGVNILRAVKKFSEYPYPDFVKRWIIIWKERQKEPRIIEIKEDLIKNT